MKSKFKIAYLVAARPNFMKVMPLMKAFENNSKIDQILIHSGQHYDVNLSDIFFTQLGLPKPKHFLGVGAKTREEQINLVKDKMIEVLSNEKPDLMVVVGDVNSTLGAAYAANALKIKLAHVEAGLRSFDNSMPEEINRILTDEISDYLFVTEPSGMANLEKENNQGQKYLVGNVMIDTLVSLLPTIKEIHAHRKFSVSQKDYFIATFHRPSNVDNKESLQILVDTLNLISERKNVIFPIHPRTKASLDKFDLRSKLSLKIITTEPLGYLDFMSLIMDSLGIITDSGGVQEETTYLKVPCITMRENTERPITAEIGSNTIVGNDINLVNKLITDILDNKYKDSKIPELWDGRTSFRIMEIIKDTLI